MKNRTILFFTAFSQVFFVAMNIYFVSKGLVFPMIITGFMISLIWSFNIGKIAFGDWIDKLIYAFGASLGTYIGWIVSHLIK